MIYIYTIVIFFLTTCAAQAEVLWEQDWDDVPEFSSGTSSIYGLSSTHTQAQVWNASSYRVPNSDESIININSSAGRSGRGVEYRMLGTDGPMGGSIDITFSDPDITWSTTIDSSGYDELYYRVWMKTPVDLDWTTGGSPPAPWKGARFYAYNSTTYPWSHFYNDNYALSSHYFTNAADSTDYKYVFTFPSWASSLMYWYSQYHGYSDTYGGTVYPNQSYNSSEAYLFDTYLDDNQWHCVEYHIKLNTVGQADSISDVYIDGTLIVDGDAGLEMRDSTSTKFMSIMLFDNYQKRSASGDQSIYLDDTVISTTYIGPDYVVESLTTVEPTCSDGIQNGTETGVDCGGSCDPCSVGGSDFINLVDFGDGVPRSFAESN